MTPEIQAGPRDHAKIQERFKTWASIPVPMSGVSFERQAAWDLYCDARDGFPDGASAAKRSLTIHVRDEDEEKQLDMFSRRRMG